MAKFAVISGKSVINTIVADSKEIAENITGQLCIEFSDNVNIGYIYDPETNTFAMPTITEYVEPELVL